MMGYSLIVCTRLTLSPPPLTQVKSPDSGGYNFFCTPFSYILGSLLLPDIAWSSVPAFLTLTGVGVQGCALSR